MQKKHFLKGLIVTALSILFTVVFAGNTYADNTTTRGLFTDSNNVRWEWERTINPLYTSETEKVSIMFYDKPEAATTVAVPSLSDVLIAIPEATQTLDTYYLKNADETYQAENYTEAEQAKRVSTANVTVLDMTNASKIQILGVAPIIDSETETELIFGENIVIGDGIEVHKSFSAYGCVGTYTYFTYSYNTGWHCDQTGTKTINNIEENVADWNALNIYEKKELQIGLDDVVGLNESIGYMDWASMIEGEFDENKPYFFHTEFKMATSVTGKGAFEGYRLKLTGLENVKYFGWYAFKDAIFNNDSRSITIKDYQTAGEGAFQGTNITSVNFEGTEIFHSMFEDCSDLTLSGVNDFGNATVIGYEAFKNVPFNGDIDFSSTNITTIKANAFENDGLTGLNFGNVSTIESWAFKGNDFSELYFPNTINELGMGVFAGSFNLKKVTVAYDTLTTGTYLQFAQVLDGEMFTWDRGYNQAVQNSIEELIVLAPYGEDEEFKSTHIPYTQYRDAGHLNYGITIYTPYFGASGGNSSQPINALEDRFYSQVDSYKNVIAPLYFAFLDNLKTITIGDGIEYIGNSAFQSRCSTGTDSLLTRSDYDTRDPLQKVVLPESLKGIGSMVFQNIYNPDFEINLPSGLEFIGMSALNELYFLDIDVDFPELRVIGDYAFYGTSVHDVVLHDKLEYVGVGVFVDCPFLHDITFDYDVFDPDMHNWWLYGSSGYRNYRLLFGSRYSYLYSSSIAEHYGLELTGLGGDVKRGKITFTEKSVHSMPALCSDYCEETSLAFFDTFTAEEIDMSAAKWEFIPEYAFQRINVERLKLPSTLKTIRSQAFLDAAIQEEVVLPETLEVVEDSAFSQSYTKSFFGEDAQTAKITKLPESLKKIGASAFYDIRLELEEFDLPNLELIGSTPFAGAKIKRIALRDSIKAIGAGAFWFVYDIEDIIIDFDMFDVDNLSVGPIGVETNRPWHSNSSYKIDMSGLSPYYFGLYFTYHETVRNPEHYYNFSNPEFVGMGEIIHEYNSITFTDKVRFIPYEVSIRKLYYCAPYYCQSNVTAGQFYNIHAKTIDLSQLTWTSIPKNTFLKSNVETVLLPQNLQYINDHAFFMATVTNGLELPDSIKRIGAEAFSNVDYASCLLYGSNCDNVNEGIKITKLPESLEEVRYGAFYGDANLALDLDLPNLRYISKSAFMRTSLTSVTLHDSIDSPIMWGAFSNIPTLETIVIDYDFYGYNNSNFDYNYYSNLEQTSISPTYVDFFSVFNREPFSEYAGDGIFNQEEVEVLPYKKVVFTEKATTNPLAWDGSYFSNSYLRFEELDMSKTGWTNFDPAYMFQNTEIGKLLLPEGLTTIRAGAFFGAKIEQPVVIPESVASIEPFAFQEAKVSFVDSFAEGLKNIGQAAFYAADISGDIVIPSTVETIGFSAFNAGETDTHYASVTIKPELLNYSKTSGQLIFQMFWNAKIDKLIIDSEVLPTMATMGKDPERGNRYISDSGSKVLIDPEDSTGPMKATPEFHGMSIKEVVLNNIGAITNYAFEECAELEKVDLSQNSNLEYIGRNAFAYASKLKTIVFGDGLVGKEVSLGEYAFRGTAIETIGDADADFNLAAANFNTIMSNVSINPDTHETEVAYGEDKYVFSAMPNLKSAYIPGTFSINAALANTDLHTNGSSIPSYTFADDPELETVEVGYDLSIIHEDAFANDNKLNKLFLWGNTDIEENGTNLTIPEPTNIFAYSDAPGQEYANDDSRSNYEGKFYPLDEVLYLTSNKSYVILEQDEEGNNVNFDKEGLILYALRRDGVILESDDWQTYTKAYPRSTVNINFEQGRGGNIGTDENIMWNVYDARKPFDLISLANENYTATSFEFMQMPSSNNPLVAIHYPDGYTNAIRTTTLATMTKDQEQTPEEPEPEDLEVPNTGVFHTISGVAVASFSISAFIILGTMLIVKKAKK